MSSWRAPNRGGDKLIGGTRSAVSRAGISWSNTAWRVIQVLVVLAAARACWQLFGQLPYRIDVDVYRMGGRAWLDGQPLYADGAMFHTRGGLDLPFTYPPLAAIAFSPLALVPLPVASVAITAITLLLLVVSIWIVLDRLEFNAGRSWWLAVGIVALSVTTLEPIRANFAFGQINVVLMTLVIADCVPRRTPWPRGILLGVAIALKLTPAVFLLYFVLRRDGRATLTALASFAVATLLGFILAWRDSWEYWTATVGHTERIGNATLNTNQNAAGALARLALGERTQFVLWTLACVAVLALTVWAVRRVLAGGDAGAAPALALALVALFGLVVSPVSWSHHWVWALPTVLVAAVLAYRGRNIALGVLAAAGTALLLWSPIELLPEHREAAASWWRQLFGMSYVWWALALIAVAGLTNSDRRSASPPQSPGSEPVADLVHPA
ncbi:MAG: glycosyltransferase family 87 protein [Mycobacterium sp.]